MPRRLLSLAIRASCLLSLLACLGFAWLWWRSGRVRAAREFDHRGVRWEVASDRGRAWLTDGPQRRIERAPVEEAERRYGEALRLANLANGRAASLWTASNARRGLGDPDRASREADDRHQDALVALEDASVLRSIASFEYARQAKRPPYARSVPLAAPAAATALPPLLWLAAWGRRRWALRRRRIGLCRRCGYDLRGTPRGGRCSECGQVPAVSPSA
jgi:hypothetical protein